MVHRSENPSHIALVMVVIVASWFVSKYFGYAGYCGPLFVVGLYFVYHLIYRIVTGRWIDES